MANVKILSNDSLLAEGFTKADIDSMMENGYVGERNGIKYFSAQVDIKMGDYRMDGSGGSVRMPDQQGERTN